MNVVQFNRSERDQTVSVVALDISERANRDRIPFALVAFA